MAKEMRIRGHPSVAEMGVGGGGGELKPQVKNVFVFVSRPCCCSSF